LHTAATICVFILLVASYDLLLGYSGFDEAELRDGAARLCRLIAGLT